MSEQENPLLDEERLIDEKKLRKRERKLRERLREAKRAQADALERLRHAEVRMRKRMAHVQQLEERLDIVHQRLGALQLKGSTVITLITAGAGAFAPLIEAPSSQKLVVEEDKRSEVSEQQAVEDVSIATPGEEVFIDSGSENKDEVSDDDVVMQARRARAVAEAAEEAARDAVARVAEAEEYLEQFGAARHLMQEFGRLQTEANKASALAREAKEAAYVAESQVKSSQEEEQREIVDIVNEERTESISEMDIGDVVPSGEPGGHPSPLEVAQSEEIEEEEETLETVAAMIIADAAGIAAARAEAVAEACSARTREARALALKADLALEAVRLAIHSQRLNGEGAEIALKAAEREATHAHAVLADAELAEESALNTAMNAEAEAEVAEGMAFAASSRDERDEKKRDEIAAHDATHSAAAEQNVDDDDDEDTLKVPVISPQKE